MLSDLLAEIDHALSENGALAECIDNFSARPQQRQMAAAVGEAVSGSPRVLVVEAGTGIGKTFAYLIPALLSGQRVVVSTGTRNLQDQLFCKDLPLVRAALKKPLSSALLKGRGNYLCLYRLALANADGRLLVRELAQLQQINAWAGRTRSGDIAEVSTLPEDSKIWPLVTSTVDNCLGGECPDYGECFLVQARKHAQDVDLLVVNHHLFCADLALRGEGFGEVLPSADVWIIDEAHQLAEIASRFFGRRVSSNQLNDFVRDSEVERERDAADDQRLADHLFELGEGVASLRGAFGRSPRRESWSTAYADPAVRGAFDEMLDRLNSVVTTLENAAVRGTGLEACFERGQRWLSRLDPFRGAAAADSHEVLWVDVRRYGFSLNRTPLSVAKQFQSRMSEYPGAWVFTSATLTVDGAFNHFAKELGLDDPRTLQLDSPFDYDRNALLYHPLDMPDPSAVSFNRALLEASLPVLDASRGRAFFLFTSHKALREAAEWLDERLDYPLLVQGEQPKNQLLERFRELGNAVLIATSSFWEGVDVRGDALSCVIIAKLPFASPGDPVLQARIEAMRQNGQNPFMELQLPHAVIALKQGVGRLIRDVSDRGVLMLGDPRLLSKPYGRVFLDSLPPMPRNRSIRAVERFFLD